MLLAHRLAPGADTVVFSEAGADSFKNALARLAAAAEPVEAVALEAVPLPSRQDLPNSESWVAANAADLPRVVVAPTSALRGAAARDGASPVESTPDDHAHAAVARSSAVAAGLASVHRADTTMSMPAAVPRTGFPLPGAGAGSGASPLRQDHSSDVDHQALPAATAGVVAAATAGAVPPMPWLVAPVAARFKPELPAGATAEFVAPTRLPSQSAGAAVMTTAVARRFVDDGGAAALRGGAGGAGDQRADNETAKTAGSAESRVSSEPLAALVGVGLSGAAAEAGFDPLKQVRWSDEAEAATRVALAAAPPTSRQGLLASGSEAVVDAADGAPTSVAPVAILTGVSGQAPAAVAGQVATADAVPAPGTVVHQAGGNLERRVWSLPPVRAGADSGRDKPPAAAARFKPEPPAGATAEVVAPTRLPSQSASAAVMATAVARRFVDDGSAVALLGAADLAGDLAGDRAAADVDMVPAGGVDLRGPAGSLSAPLGVVATGSAVEPVPDARRPAAVSPPPPEAGMAPGHLQLDLKTADGAPMRVDMTFDTAGGARLVVHAANDDTAASLIERSVQLVDAMRVLGLAVDVDVRQGNGQTPSPAAADFGASSGSRRPPHDTGPAAGRLGAADPEPARMPARNPDISAALSFYA